MKKTKRTKARLADSIALRITPDDRKFLISIDQNISRAIRLLIKEARNGN